jgi:hypothetical protein
LFEQGQKTLRPVQGSELEFLELSHDVIDPNITVGPRPTIALLRKTGYREQRLFGCAQSRAVNGQLAREKPDFPLNHPIYFLNMFSKDVKCLIPRI